MGQPAVVIEGLRKVYAGRRGMFGGKKGGAEETVAVEDLNLQIEEGEIFGLLGPNGAGKTTTVRIMCGLLPPSSGTVRVEGLSVREKPDEVRRRIGLVPEDAGDYKNLTLEEELEYHGALHGLDRATVRERSGPLLDRLGLQTAAGKRLKTYSRGMRRKFHLIRALLHRPRVLLLDEPTAGLDPSIVHEVWDLFKALASEHKVTVVLCSHHLEEVERLCSRIAILKRRLLIAGSLAELSGGGNKHRVMLAEDAVTYEAVLARVQGVMGVKVEGNVMRFEVMGETVVPEVVSALAAAGARICEVRAETGDLRSLYRSIVDGATGTVGVAA